MAEIIVLNRDREFKLLNSIEIFDWTPSSCEFYFLRFDSHNIDASSGEARAPGAGVAR